MKVKIGTFEFELVQETFFDTDIMDRFPLTEESFVPLRDAKFEAGKKYCSLHGNILIDVKKRTDTMIAFTYSCAPYEKQSDEVIRTKIRVSRDEGEYIHPLKLGRYMEIYATHEVSVKTKAPADRDTLQTIEVSAHNLPFSSLTLPPESRLEKVYIQNSAYYLEKYTGLYCAVSCKPYKIRDTETGKRFWEDEEYFAELETALARFFGSVIAFDSRFENCMDLKAEREENCAEGRFSGKEEYVNGTIRKWSVTWDWSGKFYIEVKFIMPIVRDRKDQ